LYDRLVYACVRDFIHPLPGVMYPFAWPASFAGKEVWPYVSNVADALLIVGVVMLAWRALKTPPPATRR
jgi:lipoprotein signal peptidase